MEKQMENTNKDSNDYYGYANWSTFTFKAFIDNYEPAYLEANEIVRIQIARTENPVIETAFLLKSWMYTMAIAKSGKGTMFTDSSSKEDKLDIYYNIDYYQIAKVLVADIKELGGK
tara:strand:+ start:1754 stop:2101 length:348 start_codon:yes stop_codon:yes gene_type:complete